MLELAEQTGLSELIDEQVDLPSIRVKSEAVNPAGKLTSIIAAMMCGADSIDDSNVLRAGGTPRVLDEVYAPSTLGIFLCEFTFGHAKFASRAAAPWPVRHTGHPDVAAAALGRVRLARFRRVAARRGETVPEHWELRSSPPVPILCVQTRPRSGFPRVLGLARYSRTKVTSMLTR